mmetsp:Transcript_6133/g.8954  ORF Transcript_6133/g.8954 Transcript_6133/m.8954 type:complete len:106 (+) Transcript_6133:75-392(+)|eukprot:CAMPEP_0201697360 /NCGR_PEP_ID=MMETSP0578-20130828/10951_1 /ASSEMBLY_ACC=CAM_ASM_000663 /TAXON_ID=267565 /ORGANISM="Skeletonema grethea, Strain CCMP 1804" /LENGTH=105 /DNA_ID=CAMNT_0048183523 /DNA_START=66 /DNA_END=383 /DNA_ORIENTATION=+
MSEVFGTSDKSDEVDSVGSQGDENTVEINTNSNKHPKIVEGMPEYKVLAESNSLDMILYEYIRLLFEEQKSVINLYARETQVERLRKSGARALRKNAQRKRQRSI